MDGQLITKSSTRRIGGTLVSRVSDSLRKTIAEGEYKPHDKLPSEARLTLAHGVSRTVVREAIAALRADGLVEARQGAGVFVLEPRPILSLPFQNIDYDRISSILELLELRAPVEIEAAGLAAQRRSPAQEEAILERHGELAACARAKQPTADADFALHAAIAAATNNSRFSEFLQMMGRGIIPRAILRNENADESPAVDLQQLQEEHAAIVSAISNGEVNVAREAMRLHLKGSQKRYRTLITLR